MSLQHLRRIRVVVSILFFLSIAFLFLDVGNHVPLKASTFLVSLQFIPSFLKLFGLLGISAVGFAGVLLLTLSYGRVYCSSICPLGTLQDVLIFTFDRIKGKRRFRYKRGKDAIHYAILGLTILSGLGGTLVLVDVLDPFSNFGKVATNIARPMMIFLNNAAAGVLNDAQIYTFYQIPIAALPLAVVVYSSFFLLLLLYLCIDQGRLFCNLLCPVGALLKVLSRYSLFRLVISTSACKDCGLCEKVCKARCIDSKARRLDFGSCISCFNCIDVCPTAGVVYEGFPRRRSAVQNAVHDSGRRKAVGSMASAFVIAGAGTVVGKGPLDSLKISTAGKRIPITPPGSLSVSRFSQLCTACHLCVSACPTQVICPSFFEYGIQGIFQPSLNYTTGYCKYDCNLCSQVCPSGAIALVDIESKKEIQLGKARFVKDDCIVVAKKTECGACSEHCPTKAVSMVPYEKLLLPELNNDICVGCGACERACPTKPAKAIYVESNPVHLRAKKPQVKNLEPEVDTQEFPF